MTPKKLLAAVLFGILSGAMGLAQIDSNKIRVAVVVTLAILITLFIYFAVRFSRPSR